MPRHRMPVNSQQSAHGVDRTCFRQASCSARNTAHAGGPPTPAPAPALAPAPASTSASTPDATEPDAAPACPCRVASLHRPPNSDRSCARLLVLPVLVPLFWCPYCTSSPAPSCCRRCCRCCCCRAMLPQPCADLGCAEARAVWLAPPPPSMSTSCSLHGASHASQSSSAPCPPSYNRQELGAAAVGCGPQEGSSTATECEATEVDRRWRCGAAPGPWDPPVNTLLAPAPGLPWWE